MTQAKARRPTEPRLLLFCRYLRLRPRYREGPSGFRERSRQVLYGDAFFAKSHQPGFVRVSVLDELQLKRERENQEAERHRRRRDELNDKTREWVEKRDALNAQVRTLVDEATQHRIKRDELNALVKAAKEERDRNNRRVEQRPEQNKQLKTRELPPGSLPPRQLQQG